MNGKIVKFCSYSGCNGIVVKMNLCQRHYEQHRIQMQKQRYEKAGQTRKPYYDAEWTAFSKQLLITNNTCCLCGGKATLLHHGLPVKTNPEFKLSKFNCFPMDHRCHQGIEARIKNENITWKDILEERGMTLEQCHCK